MAMAPNQTDVMSSLSLEDDIREEPCPDALIHPPSINRKDKTFRSSVLPIVIVAILLGLVSGTAYGFGRYARTLKEILGISQSQVQTLGIFMDCGNYVGHPVVGYIYDKSGPVLSCVLGAILAFVCYWRICSTLMHHDVTQHGEMLSSAGILWLKLAFFGVGFSSGLGYLSGLGSTTKAIMRLSSNGSSSSKYFGTCIGIVAASCGLSSLLVGISYNHLTDLSTFFWFWALLVPVVNVFAAGMFQLQAKTSSNPHTYSAVEQGTDDGRSEGGPLLECPRTLELAEETQGSNRESSQDELETVKAPWDSWKQSEFWLLFASFSCATGCGLMVINNLSTMVQSMGGSDSLAGTLVIVLSFSNVGGRILMGMMGDAATSKSSSLVLPRIRLLQGVNLIMVSAMCLAFLGGQQEILFGAFVVVVAMAYGSAWVLIVALTPNLFAKEHFGKDYGLLALGPALSGIVFNQASAKWYEQHVSEDNLICVGRECYGQAYVAAGSMAALGIIITGILYKKQSFKEQQEEQ